MAYTILACARKKQTKQKNQIHEIEKRRWWWEKENKNHLRRSSGEVHIIE